MEWYDPTEEEREAIERAGLEAAWEALQPLNDEDLEMSHKVKAGIEAFRAAKKAVAEAKARLKEEKGTEISCYPEVFPLVASAAFAVGHPDIEEVHPYCVGGGPIEAVMRAAMVFQATQLLWDAFDDDEDVVSEAYIAGEADRIVSAFSKA